MPTPEPMIEELLDLLEELSRCPTIKFKGIPALLLGPARLKNLRDTVTTHRPYPWYLEGGRRYRNGVCVDKET